MVIARAPVRISLGGGGTDLAAYYTRFGGFVVNAAITRYASVVARPRPGGGIRITSADYKLSEIYAPGVLPPVAEPLSLPKAAIEYFAPHGLVEMGVDLHLAGGVPPGTGLGSSSAMAVALVTALGAYLGRPLAAREAAEAACWLEIDRLDHPIGKQDQYASAFGGLNTLELSADGVHVAPLRLPDGVQDALNTRLMLFESGQRRDSAHILRDQRANTRTKTTVVESLHHIKALAGEMVDALRAGNLDDFGRLLDKSWQEKRRLSNRVSSAAIEEWYTAARGAGALGGKIAGAGGGGFMLLYCPPEYQTRVRQALGRYGLREMAFDFDPHGAQVVHNEMPTPLDELERQAA